MKFEGYLLRPKSFYSKFITFIYSLVSIAFVDTCLDFKFVTTKVKILNELGFTLCSYGVGEKATSDSALKFELIIFTTSYVSTINLDSEKIFLISDQKVKFQLFV